MKLYLVNRIIRGADEKLLIAATSAPGALRIADDIKACKEGDRKQRERWGCNASSTHLSASIRWI